MTTNISYLPQLEGNAIVVTNADWRDNIQFQYAAPDPRAGQPIDITGIAFEAQLRPSAADTAVLLNMSTSNGLLVTDGPLGQLSFAVPRDQPVGGTPGNMSGLSVPAGVLDIIAMGDGQIINLFQVSGSMAVTINTGVTRS